MPRAGAGYRLFWKKRNVTWPYHPWRNIFFPRPRFGAPSAVDGRNFGALVPLRPLFLVSFEVQGRSCTFRSQVALLLDSFSSRGLTKNVWSPSWVVRKPCGVGYTPALLLTVSSFILVDENDAIFFTLEGIGAAIYSGPAVDVPHSIDCSIIGDEVWLLRSSLFMSVVCGDLISGNFSKPGRDAMAPPSCTSFHNSFQGGNVMHENESTIR